MLYTSRVLNGDPIEWLIQQRKNEPERKIIILHTIRITKKQHEALYNIPSPTEE